MLRTGVVITDGNNLHAKPGGSLRTIYVGTDAAFLAKVAINPYDSAEK
jgi:hypothetical protein